MARSYLDFASLFVRGSVKENDSASLNLSEIELQSLFFAGHLGRSFKSLDGKNIQIQQFGEWNHGPGPDFLNCACTIDNVLHKGPIELDTHPNDWEAHRHATNPEFEEVILHLSVKSAAQTTFIRTLNHREIPQVQIPQDRLTTLLPPPLSQAPVTLGRCYFPFSKMEMSRVEDLLKKAALQRSLSKANHFHCVTETHGRAQALWQALATTLGYHKNQLPMTLLAQRAPLSKMRNLTPLDRTGYLFGLAGFLTPDLPNSAPPDSHQWLRDLWSSWWKNRPHPDPRPLPWRLACIRPANHPQRRVAALANLLSIWPSLEKLSQNSLPAFTSKLRSCSDSFWNQHYTLTSSPIEKNIALFGEQRARDFLTNVLHPLRLAEDPEQNWPPYSNLSGGPPSERVKRAAYRLFGNREEKNLFLKKAWHQQALLQVYQDFCLQDHSDCDQCPFPEQLLTW